MASRASHFNIYLYNNPNKISFFSENEIVKAREENRANVEAYKKEKDAAANTKLYTQDYVRLELAKELSKNTKFYFSGETSPLGSLLNKVLGDS